MALSPTNYKNQFKFIIITTRLIISIAENLQSLLLENGYKAIIKLYLSEADINNTSANDKYIILYNNRKDSKIPKNSIFYQLEQTESTNVNLISAQKAQVVWDMSIKNYSKYKAIIPFKNVFIMPMPFCYKETNNVLYKDIVYDIFFYGSVNERRKAILSEIQKAFPKTKIGWGTFGVQRDYFIKEAKIIVNLHYYKDAVLEAARFNEVLQFNKLIISEGSEHVDDFYSHYIYKDYIEVCEVINDDLSNIGSILNLLKTYLNDNNKYERKINFIKDNKYKLKNLSKYFMTKNLLSVIKPVEIKIDYDLVQSTIYCLSLVETPDRFRAFSAQDIYKKNKSIFELVPAIKYEPGWKGCAFSYVNMIYNAKRCSLKTVTICEDDCSFKPDFAAKYRIIQDFLNLIKGWDIFVGVLAHLPDDTKLNKIYKYKGVTFIEINKMHSMVFNIYNSSVYDIFLKWDINTSSQVNQIDQYLKNSNLRIIVPVPFEFGCLDVKSTLWSGDLFTAYNKLFEKSNQVIKQLMDTYLLTNKIVEVGTKGGYNSRKRGLGRRRLTFKV